MSAVHRFVQAVVAELEGLRISEIGLGLLSVDVPPELVEEQDHREAALRAGGPAVERARARLLDQLAEPLLDESVDAGALLPPQLVPAGSLLAFGGLAEPEVQDLLDLLVHCAIPRLGEVGPWAPGPARSRISRPGWQARMPVARKKEARMPVCRECEDEIEADEVVKLKVGRKTLKLCEDCADRMREEREIAEASEGVIQDMMGFKGRR